VKIDKFLLVKQTNLQIQSDEKSFEHYDIIWEIKSIEKLYFIHMNLIATEFCCKLIVSRWFDCEDIDLDEDKNRKCFSWLDLHNLNVI